MPMVPLATVVGAPRLLVGLPPETLLMEPTLRVMPTPATLAPPAISVLPVYVLAPPKVILPALLPLRVKAPLPVIGPERVSGAVLLPLFRRPIVNVCKAQEPVRITGVFAAEAKLTVHAPVTFVQLLARVPLTLPLPQIPP